MKRSSWKSQTSSAGATGIPLKSLCASTPGPVHCTTTLGSLQSKQWQIIDLEDGRFVGVLRIFGLLFMKGRASVGAICLGRLRRIPAVEAIDLHLMTQTRRRRLGLRDRPRKTIRRLLMGEILVSLMIGISLVSGGRKVEEYESDVV